jgi:hypothetical protein
MSYQAPPTNPFNQPTNPQPPYPPRAPYPYAQPPKKSNNALKFILIGCGGLILVGALSLGGLYWYLNKKVHEYGFDKNPEMAAVKLMINANPDVELLSSDDEAKTFTVKDKKTGKIVTLTFEKTANGKFALKVKEGDKEVAMKITGDKNQGSIEVSSSDGGKAKFGSVSTDDLPSWVPKYPGVTLNGMYATENDDSQGKGFNFSTSDSIQEVMNFYERALKEQGFQVTTTKTQTNGQDGGSVSSNDSDYKRFVVVGISTADGKTSVFVTSQLNKKR